MFDIGLDSPQQERPQDFVQLLNDGILVFGVVTFLLEPLVEVLAKVST